MITPNEFATGQDDESSSSSAIRAEIEKTRERLEDTVEALGAQLNPSNLKRRVKDSVREATIGRVQHMATNTRERITETGRGLAQTVRDNPLPAAMAAAGIGWLLLSSRNERSTPRFTDGVGDYLPDETDKSRMESGMRHAAETVSGKAHELTERVQETGHRVAQRAQETTQRVAQRARETGARVAERADHAMHRARDRARTAAHRVENQYEESPIGLGVVALAVGLAVGLSIPATRREAELMGNARDKLVDKTRETVASTTDRVERVIERAIPEVQNVVRDAAREVREAVREEGLPG